MTDRGRRGDGGSTAQGAVDDPPEVLAADEEAVAGLDVDAAEELSDEEDESDEPDEGAPAVLVAPVAPDALEEDRESVL